MNRFSQKDIIRGSITDGLSLNRYLYCANDPVNFVDPSGMTWKSAFQKVAGAVRNTVQSVIADPIGTAAKAANAVVKAVTNPIGTAVNVVQSAAKAVKSFCEEVKRPAAEATDPTPKGTTVTEDGIGIGYGITYPGVTEDGYRLGSGAYDANGNATSYFNSSYDQGVIPSPDAPRIADATEQEIAKCANGEKKTNTFLTQKQLQELALDRINDGGLQILGGTIAAVLGFSAAIIAGTVSLPVIAGLAVAAAATMAVSYGANEIVEGATNIRLGSQGDVNTKSYNQLRDTLFNGNQTAYDIYGAVGMASSGTYIVLAPALNSIGSSVTDVVNGVDNSSKGYDGIIHNDVIDIPRTGSALKVDQVDPIIDMNGNILKEFPSKAQAHGFTDIVDNYAGYATKFDIDNGTLYQVEGSLNGIEGRFEWIIQDGSLTHRMFVFGGNVNGVPIKR